MEKLIITAAITGAVTVPTQTPYLPWNSHMIAEDAVRASEAGAAIVHIHARNPEDGSPTTQLDYFKEICERIKSKSDVIIGITTGGPFTATAEERICAVPALQPELASFNMGSINFSVHRVAEKYKAADYKYPWEQSYLEMSKDYVFRNTFADLEYFCNTMKKYGTVAEHEVYDIGHLYNMRYLLNKGFIQPPHWIQFVTGVLGGIYASPEEVMHLKATADRVLGVSSYRWSVVGVGYPQEFQLAAMAMIMGGHVRVGLEDNIYIAKGVLAKSNAELVEKVVRLARELEREPATPDETRKLLGLKGLHKVNF